MVTGGIWWYPGGVWWYLVVTGGIWWYLVVSGGIPCLAGLSVEEIDNMKLKALRRALEERGERYSEVTRVLGSG